AELDLPASCWGTCLVLLTFLIRLDAGPKKSALLLDRILAHSTFYPFLPPILRQKTIFAPVTKVTSLMEPKPGREHRDRSARWILIRTLSEIPGQPESRSSLVGAAPGAPVAGPATLPI